MQHPGSQATCQTSGPDAAGCTQSDVGVQGGELQLAAELAGAAIAEPGGAPPAGAQLVHVTAGGAPEGAPAGASVPADLLAVGNADRSLPSPLPLPLLLPPHVAVLLTARVLWWGGGAFWRCFQSLVGKAIPGVAPGPRLLAPPGLPTAFVPLQLQDSLESWML